MKKRFLLGLLAFAVPATQASAQSADDRQPSLSRVDYVVDGLALGQKVRPESSAYRRYQCNRSSQFEGTIWCQRQGSEMGINGPFASATSILHDASGTTLYINRYVEPAFFRSGEIQSQIDRLTRRYGPPTIQNLTKEGVPGAVIALFGNIRLEPLNEVQIAGIKVGKRAQGFIPMDFLGDFQKSAQLALPLFRLAGRDGYVWSASSDAFGRGHLRFLAANPSSFDSNAVLVDLPLAGFANDPSATKPPSIDYDESSRPKHDNVAGVANPQSDALQTAPVANNSVHVEAQTPPSQKQAFGGSAAPDHQGPRILPTTVKSSTGPMWDRLPATTFRCVQTGVKQSSGRDLQDLIDHNIRPFDPEVKSLVDACSKQSYGEEARDFVGWVGDIGLARPEMTKAFQQCQEIIALFEDRVIRHLTSMEGESASKAEQQRTHDIVTALSDKRDEAKSIACIKQFIVVLKVGGSQTGYFADELAVVNGKLINRSIDLRKVAAQKIEDLTPRGWTLLSADLGMEQLNPDQLQSEIDSLSKSPSGLGYLACLMPKDWVGWFSSDTFCHGDALESGLASAAQSISLKH
jgi:hypothetical protein